MVQETTKNSRLYAVRTFGENITAVMDFIRENWKPLLKYLTYFLLPVCMIGSLGLNSFMGSYMEMIESFTGSIDNVPDTSRLASMGISGVAYVLLILVASGLLNTVLFTFMRMRLLKGTDLNGITFSDMKPDFNYCLKRTLLLIPAAILIFVVVFSLFVVLVFALALITPVLGLLAYVLMFVVLLVCIPLLSLITPTYMMEEDTGLFKAISKGIRLAFRSFWVILGVEACLYLVYTIVSQFFGLPWMIMMFIKMFFGLGIEELDSSWVNNVFFDFAYFLSAVLLTFGGQLLYTLFYIATTYLYGHAAEKADHFSIESNISQFDQL